MVKKLKDVNFEEFYKINEYVAKTSPMRTHYHSSNPAERWLWSQKKEFIRKELSKLPIKNLIDFGCGDGIILEILDDKINYSGIDISPTQIKYAKERAKNLNKKNVKFYNQDILDYRVKENYFDAAIACDVIEHVISPEKLFLNLKKAVKNNGYILISIPNEPLWETARGILLKFPLRSPDHINAVFPSDIYYYFPNVIKRKNIPFNFSEKLSLINTFLIKNVK